MSQYNYLIAFLCSIPGLIVATTIHEFTRAMVSSACGDPMPKNMGRLTLNPLKHFEPIGFLLLFYTGGFGWGKPVETSGLYYKNRKQDTLLTAIMPSVINLVLGIIFLGVYLRLPIQSDVVRIICNYLYYYNIGIAIYNILPISPMDCVKVLSVVLPANKYYTYLQYEKVIQMIFLFLLFLGFLNPILHTIVNAIIQLFAGIFLVF